jgi:hypothetical protein
VVNFTGKIESIARIALEFQDMRMDQEEVREREQTVR